MGCDPTVPCLHLQNPLDTEAFPLSSRSDARARLGLRSDSTIVGFVGGPNQPRKGFGRLASAVGQLIHKRKDLILLAVGGSDSSIGASAAQVLSPASPLNAGLERPPAPGVAPSIASNTIVVGGVDRSLMADLYSSMDLLVHPSAADNLPTVPIEAGLAGTRPLATATAPRRPLHLKPTFSTLGLPPLPALSTPNSMRQRSRATVRRAP